MNRKVVRHKLALLGVAFSFPWGINAMELSTVQQPWERGASFQEVERSFNSGVESVLEEKFFPEREDLKCQLIQTKDGKKLKVIEKIRSFDGFEDHARGEEFMVKVGHFLGVPELFPPVITRDITEKGQKTLISYHVDTDEGGIWSREKELTQAQQEASGWNRFKVLSFIFGIDPKECNILFPLLSSSSQERGILSADNESVVVPSVTLKYGDYPYIRWMLRKEEGRVEDPWTLLQKNQSSIPDLVKEIDSQDADSCVKFYDDVYPAFKQGHSSATERDEKIRQIQNLFRGQKTNYFISPEEGALYIQRFKAFHPYVPAEKLREEEIFLENLRKLDKETLHHFWGDINLEKNEVPMPDSYFMTLLQRRDWVLADLDK